jgi:CubicO group peptidase (beta-lactamase class C family)
MRPSVVRHILKKSGGEQKVAMARLPKDKWLSAAIDYIPAWIDLQLRASGQPGCVVAIAFKDRILLEQAFGCADLSTGEKLTPRHRFRVASHSKSFTAAGVMKLREQGRLKLDDPVGDYVGDLSPGIARATIGQVLSHSAGITRDGPDCGQYEGRRPYLSAREVLSDLAADRAQLAIQIFQSRLRSSRPADRGDREGAVHGLDQA